MKSNKVIAITMGDPDGIGPEIIQKALAQKSFFGQARFIVIGNKKLFKALDPKVGLMDVSYQSAGQGALQSLEQAVLLIKGGIADALVTAPLSKEVVSRYHKNFVGHTEYLAEAFDARDIDMMFVASDIRLTIVTRHVPLKNVPELITTQAVLASIKLMHKTLKEQFGIKVPRIAVLGLNPHAGEAGLLGDEDIKQIGPAIRQAKSIGIKAIGPLPADTFFAFHQGPKSMYDGIIAMYHDQGLAPLKAVYMNELVNFTAGLPFVRTSPAHGTAFDIAGQNKADPSSMVASIKLACDLA
ncbi:MAG: 4-hydroxythreonine-4-phosphate dehydrogenase PdxA [Candidatus Omnitrophica bacterium]|nr:4-hydroxythreonine-4-phosphate dehydrogenase PdxA [Candidatus Omnitrophota bacterium]